MNSNNNNSAYRDSWKQKLDGIAFPVMERFVDADEAQEIIIDFIEVIAKARKLVPDQRAGVQIDLVKMAFTMALNLMDEMGY